MTPAESRDATLALSRERLARAISKFERLARDAAETIGGLRQEKSVLEKRLTDLTKLVEQERSNFEQRAALLQSVNTETEQRAKAFDELTCRLDDQERLMNEQIEMISRLESELEASGHQIKGHLELKAAWKGELDDWHTKVEQLEDRLKKAQDERDHIKSAMYQREREEAQYAIKLSPEIRDKAAETIDSLLKRLSSMESRVLSAAEEK